VRVPIFDPHTQLIVHSANYIANKENIRFHKKKKKAFLLLAKKDLNSDISKEKLWSRKIITFKNNFIDNVGQ
jgi:hypothetical protein